METMLAQQVITDQQGMPMGVFIPIQSWNTLIVQYPEITALETDLPQWEKDFIDSRLDMIQRYPERLKPIEMLLKTL
jgi:hypothetical protein